MVCMDARRASDALKARAEKTDKADARALAEMLASGWYSAVHVKSLESHQLKALLGARDQLVRVKRQPTDMGRSRALLSGRFENVGGARARTGPRNNPIRDEKAL